MRLNYVYNICTANTPVQRLYSKIYVRLAFVRVADMVGKGILWVDMYLRDQRALAWINLQVSSGPQQISYQEIAFAIGCHRRTARAIVHRLAGAQLIQVDKSSKRGGYVYRAVN